MPRYIDADALISDMHMKLCDLRNDSYISGDYRTGFAFCMEFVKTAPTVTPDEVRGKGKWIRISGFHLDHEYYPARYQCDQCKHFVDSGDDKNYCPNCGAKMEVSEDE